jgi:hypothetical protein
MISYINTALNFYLGSMGASFYLFVHSNNDMFRPYNDHHQVYVCVYMTVHLKLPSFYTHSGDESIEEFKSNFIFVNTPYRIPKCTNTLYDYAIINY